MAITFFMEGMLGKFTLDELKWGHVKVRDSFTELQFQNNHPNQEARSPMQKLAPLTRNNSY
jgi:hypothetical protein